MNLGDRFDNDGRFWLFNTKIGRIIPIVLLLVFVTSAVILEQLFNIKIEF